MFEATRTSPASYIQDVNTLYSINWGSMSWVDLRKPLYSGLAARIYTEITRGTDDIPRSIDDQENFYFKYYRTSGDPDVFSNKAEKLEKGKTKK